MSLLINASMCVCLFLYSLVSVCLPHLLLQYAVKDEDEHALQRVEDGEKVGHDDGALVDVHQPKSPSQAQQTQQGYGPDHPRPRRRGEIIEREKCCMSLSVKVSLNVLHS